MLPGLSSSLGTKRDAEGLSLRRARQDALILPFVAALVLLADQVSKYLVTASLEEGQSWGVVPWLAPVLRVTHVTNTGAAFGMLPGLGGVFAYIAVAVIVVIIVFYRRLPAGQSLMRVSLGLQLGGAIGNLADRIARGSVVDFIDLSFWPFKDFPVFNLADSSIVVGVATLAVLMILEDQRERGPQQAVSGG